VENGRDIDAINESRESAPIPLRERLALRLSDSKETVQPRMPSRLKGDAGSVRASLAKRLINTKMLGRGSGSSMGSGKPTGGKTAVGSISVRASQRVVVKAFVARHTGPSGVANPGKSIAQHVRYLARDGVGYDGTEAEFYGQNGGLEREAVNDETSAWAQDRHHFRLIISPEQADKMEDLQGYVRDVMSDVAKDLNEAALNWVAVNHFDTDQPHAHVLIRGVRAKGSALIIPRQIISHGIRGRAEEHAQILLGDKSRSEAERQLYARTKANYWTDIDARLSKLARTNEGVLAANELNRHDTFGALARGRVIHLERMGLATRAKEGVIFAADMKQRLDTLARSRDEIRSYWDRERGKAFGAVEQAESKSKTANRNHATVSQADVRSLVMDEASSAQNFDLTTNRLTTADIILAARANKTGQIERLGSNVEVQLAARASYLVKSGLGRTMGQGIAFDATSWRKLKDNEINAAAREQLGLARGQIASQLSASEGKVLGHIDTSLGRHAIIDRGINIVAVRELAGAETTVGQVLGAGVGIGR
jgi:type IV secretory pathway VirD2 relaxase